MNYPIKIVACVVDVHNLTMYKADGDTIVIPQGDPRLKDLVANMVPAIEGNGYYMLTAEDLSYRNHFADAEQKTNGFVRFFKMAKAKAKELLDKFVEPIGFLEVGTKKEPELTMAVSNSPGVIAEVPEPIAVAEIPFVEPEPIFPKEEERPLTKSAAAVAEIMANAKPAVSPSFSVPDAQGEEETTVIAVLADNTIIPGCEALAQQAAAQYEGSGNGTGIENFLRRAGSMARGHSVEDLLKFIQKGELPLADDGSVLVYKLLRRTKDEGVFVDCHSGNVKQRVGSFVHMDEKMVDPNRGQDCSNGLHVARRDYLKNFSGDVCVLAKLAPEDVIAVPRFDARKLRAKGYHIIAELSDKDRRLVCADQPMSDQVLLGNAIAGNHVGILEMVQITQSKGGGLIITPVDGAVEGSPALDHSLTGESLDNLPLADNPEACVVDARELALKQAAPKDQKIMAPPGGMVVESEPVGEATPVPLVAAVKPVAKPAKAKASPAKPAAPKPVVKAAAPKKVGKVTQQEEMAKLVALYEKNPDKMNARAIYAFKQKAKKGWDVLGVTDAKFIKKITERAKL
jgi:hypothetical protein